MPVMREPGLGRHFAQGRYWQGELSATIFQDTEGTPRCCSRSMSIYHLDKDVGVKFVVVIRLSGKSALAYGEGWSSVYIEGTSIDEAPFVPR
jgi:hypothetical protein